MSRPRCKNKNLLGRILIPNQPAEVQLAIFLLGTAGANGFFLFAHLRLRYYSTKR